MRPVGNYQAPWVRGSFGWVLAFIGLIIVIVLAIGDQVISRNMILGMFALAYLSVLL
jgi:hypothetical protein